MGMIDDRMQATKDTTDRETALFHELVEFVFPHHKEVMRETIAECVHEDARKLLDAEVAFHGAQSGWTDAQVKEKQEEVRGEARGSTAELLALHTDEVIKCTAVDVVGAWIETIERAAGEDGDPEPTIDRRSFDDAMLPTNRVEHFRAIVQAETLLSADDGYDTLARAKRSLPAGKAVPDALVEYLKIASGVTVI